MTALSVREQQICNKVVLGWTGREIGDSLGISHRTVESHRLAIMKKYGVHNLVQLVRAVYGIAEPSAEPAREVG